MFRRKFKRKFAKRSGFKRRKKFGKRLTNYKVSRGGTRL